MIFIMQGENNEEKTKNHSDFSIEHILKRAGENSNKNKEKDIPENFTWLHCTRFCPPKVARTSRRSGPQKRQLGRYPRIPFTAQQLAILEEKFQQSPYLSSEEATELSQKLQLADVKVKIWFQNRRARKRRETMTELKKNDEKLKLEERISTNNGSSSGETSKESDLYAIPVPFIYHMNPHNVSNLTMR